MDAAETRWTGIGGLELVELSRVLTRTLHMEATLLGHSEFQSDTALKLLPADQKIDELYATLTLVPLNEASEDSFDYFEPPICTRSKTRNFTKMLTLLETSTHGGFSVPRKVAENCFPPLDTILTPDKNGQIPPLSEELMAKDFHNNEWKFWHIYRGQLKRYLLTTGWSVFVNHKRLLAGDDVMFLI
ncbi:hypothetical protein R1sor_015710 [Riccia sorocarpa]|uniref:TF-B3 domain-containing protein n=1 Tax=Riccia sorocarpa TaxID=122646 RepID=A0ABD3HET1_9MARC